MRWIRLGCDSNMTDEIAVTKDEIDDPENLALKKYINDELM